MRWVQLCEVNPAILDSWKNFTLVLNCALSLLQVLICPSPNLISGEKLAVRSCAKIMPYSVSPTSPLFTIHWYFLTNPVIKDFWSLLEIEFRNKIEKTILVNDVAVNSNTNCSIKLLILKFKVTFLRANVRLFHQKTWVTIQWYEYFASSIISRLHVHRIA